MTPKERKTYFRLWQDACLAREWDTKDDDQRRAICLDCMQQVGGPAVTTSHSDFGPDETTALFTYLRHLGDPSSFDLSAEWVKCKEDYRTYNRARQADWHEEALYGKGKNKLDRNRFAGAATAAGGPLDSLDKKTVDQRHLTLATRHQGKRRKARAAAKGQDLASHAPASTADLIGLTPDPAIASVPMPQSTPPSGPNRYTEDVPF